VSIISEIKKNSAKVFRRLYIKRREQSGEYETDWQLIDPKYILTYGNITFSIDDIIPYYFKFNGVTFTVQNSDGYFGDESDDKSFFYGYLTRFRSLVKIEAGYEASDGTEYPTNTTLYLGLLSEDMVYTQDAKISFATKHISSIFEEFPSDQITGLGSTMTASDMVFNIKNHVDANSVAIFQKYFTTWNIDTTTGFYDIATTTALNNASCWELMKKLAVPENRVVYVDRDGSFNFKDKDNISSTSVFHFGGLGDSDKTYGHNILDQIKVDENIRKVYNRIKVKFASEDTQTSYYILNENWTWGDSSSSFKFGVREYSYENMFLQDTDTALTVANAMYNDFNQSKKEVTIKTKFVPQLMVMNHVTMSYITQIYSGGYLWNYFDWGSGIFGSRSGYNINIDNQDFSIIELQHNIDNFYSQVKLRAI